MSKPIVAFLLLVAGTGCAGPTIATREVQREATWFVRLDTYADPKAAAGLNFDHPATLPAEDVAAIMGRFQVQERVALLEQTPPPQSFFSPEEIRRLAPPVQKALRTAGPSEWVVFYVGRPAGAPQDITSGGFFLKGGNSTWCSPTIASGFFRVRTAPRRSWPIPCARWEDAHSA